jgi:hypothetical protein
MIYFTSRGGAVWSARVAHNHKVVGSNPTPATKKNVSASAGTFFLRFGIEFAPSTAPCKRRKVVWSRSAERKLVLARVPFGAEEALRPIILPPQPRKNSEHCSEFSLSLRFLGVNYLKPIL